MLKEMLLALTPGFAESFPNASLLSGKMMYGSLACAAERSNTDESHPVKEDGQKPCHLNIHSVSTHVFTNMFKLK